MFSEHDIWLAASAMMQRYGSNAAKEVAGRADDALERGDLEGNASWQRILAAIEQLQTEKRTAGEKVQ